MGNNGYNGNINATDIENESVVIAPKNNVEVKESNIGLALFPFTPVSFTGPHALVAWGRALGYGMLAYATWKNQRNLSCILMSAAGISVISSLAGKAWNGGK